MRTKDLSLARLKTAGIGTFFHLKDVKSLGATFHDIEWLMARGEVEKIAPGLYRVSDVEANEFETLAMVAAAVPDGIICLLSALSFHEIGTQSPHEVWLALDRKARKPSRPVTSLRFVRFSGAMLRYGIVSYNILGVTARITSPARTVVDCFRYRNKIGMDVALEALEDAVRTRKTSIDEIVRAAEVCRSRTVIQPYLEAIAA
jgi:predicted transcriptional regulator of viral defense system